MSVTEVIEKIIRAKYDESPANRYPTEGALTVALLDGLNAAGYAVTEPLPPLKRDACVSCSVELRPVFEFEDARTPTKQYANALQIDMYGGYGMFFDDASHHVFLCHDCAHAACDALPWLSDLIQPHASHMHAAVTS